MRSLLVVLLLSAAPALVSARSGGPPAGRVHQCGLQPGCESGCHAPANDARTEVSVELLAPNPGPFPPATGWVPDQRYTLLIEVVEQALGPRCAHGPTSNACTPSIPADACYIGFQMTAIEEASCGTPTQNQAGCFEAGPETAIACPSPCGVCPGGPQQYIGHTNGCIVPQTITPTEQIRTWTVDWTAPSTGFGTVQFYWAVNSTNADLSLTGDTPVFGNATWDEVVPPCDLLSESDDAPVDKALLFADLTSCGDPVPPIVLISGFSASPSQIVDSIGGPTLTVYQVDCPCPGELFLTESAGSVLAEFM